MGQRPDRSASDENLAHILGLTGHYHDRYFASALEAHIEGFIQVEQLQLPKTVEPCKKDPRLFPTGEMRRDTVRHDEIVSIIQKSDKEYVRIDADTGRMDRDRDLAKKSS